MPLPLLRNSFTKFGQRGLAPGLNNRVRFWLCALIMASFRGEIWFRFGELPGSSSNQPAYLFSTGSFGSDFPIAFEAGRPFINLRHPNGRTIIFTIKSDGSNVQQAHFPELTSGLAYGAMGAIEINYASTGKFLYQITDGVAHYNSGNSEIRVTLHTDGGRAA